MHIYRLEFAENHKFGPFNPPTSMFEQMTGVRMTMEPANAAQAVAVLDDATGPYDMPGIVNDGVTESQMNRFKLIHGDAFFGFASLEQYRQWFPTKNERTVLFKRVSLNRHTEKGDGTAPFKFSYHLELRCYDVPDRDVLVAQHQVVFNINDAVSSKKVSIKEATA